MNLLSKYKYQIVVFVICVAFVFIGAYILRLLIPPQADESNINNMISCIDRFVGSTDVNKIDISLKNAAAEYCYRVFNGSQLLNDFNIRRLKFFQQQYDEIVMLWMVVAITLSGVVLAGVQLAVSYNLSLSRRQDIASDLTEFTIAHDRVVFRSSVTGLAILAISFGFFLVFVLEIYTIREINPDKKPTDGRMEQSVLSHGSSDTNGYGQTTLPK